jgi:hypothetical protein
MHIAYSAINTVTTNQLSQAGEYNTQTNSELILRYQAYEATCNKYRHEIAAIQKYLPGWVPKFQY